MSSALPSINKIIQYDIPIIDNNEDMKKDKKIEKNLREI